MQDREADKMRTIMTVTGPIKPEQAGFTSMHDHILTNTGFYRDEYASLIGEPPATLFPPDTNTPVRLEDLAYLSHGYFVRSNDAWNLDDEALMGAEVKDFKDAGGGAILECSAPGIRPNVVGLKRISQQTGVYIIASTGLYGEKSWPDNFRNMSVDDFVRYMNREIERGMEDTNIKAGHIKTAVNQITDRQLEFIIAAARSSNDTGALVTAHLGLFTTIEDSRLVYQKFLDAGIAPEKLLMCHQQMYFHEANLVTLITNPDSWRLQLDYARELMDLGINICIDCFGMTWDAEALGMVMQKDHVTMAGLVSLINDGYAGQIVIGTDVFIKLMTRRYGGHGYCRLLNYVAPTLKKVGIADETVRQITIDNPARLLAIRS
jgi:phosphotriesterase-related protein